MLDIGVDRQVADHRSLGAVSDCCHTWSDGGSMVVRWWSVFGPIVVRVWSDGGSMVVRWWSDGGSMVVRVWFDGGPCYIIFLDT